MNSSQSFLRSSAFMSVSDLYFFCFFSAAMTPSSWWRMPWPSAGSMSSAFSITTSEYIMIRRR